MSNSEYREYFISNYKLQLADTVTKDISSGRYVYDIMMTLADSTIEVVHKGILTVNPRVTQL